jgi:hypothetical protein
MKQVAESSIGEKKETATSFGRATKPSKALIEVKRGRAPVDDNGFARKAGEIIARAAHSKDAVHRRRGNRR